MISDKEILKVLKDGRIIIEPFQQINLGTNSYDVTLGSNTYVPNNSVRIVDLWSKEDCTDFWTYKKSESVVTVFPGETILGHTQEIVGCLRDYTTQMFARSSIARCGVSVCKCAGLGDVGFVNHWTMEITNHLSVPVSLRVGMRIAQITFEFVGPTKNIYMGKYKSDCQNWEPSDMLPKLWLDRELSL